MVETTLSGDLVRERAEAIRTLLARPLLDGATHRDEFRLIVGCRAWLEEWFDSTCGWQLVVDVHGGFARLVKRTDRPDETRPARRMRGAQAPFGRRRYELLCLLCAELSSHPVTTIGLLASGVASASASYPTARFDSANQRERAAFVDAIKLLAGWGIVVFSAGDVDAFVGCQQANAIVTANTSRLHHLLSSATAPSAISAHDATDAIRSLTTEPRYGDAPQSSIEVDAEQRLRWVRHSLARRLLDDPALYVDELTEEQRSYLSNPAGRRWLRDRATEAGFDLEERLEGLVAVDVETVSSDVLFPGPGSNVKQTALLLIERFVTVDVPGRRLVDRDIFEITAAVRDLLAVHPGWARQYRDDHGPARLAEEAVELLARLRLVERTGDAVRPRPAIARYAPGEPRRQGRTDETSSSEQPALMADVESAEVEP